MADHVRSCQHKSLQRVCYRPPMDIEKDSLASQLDGLLPETSLGSAHPAGDGVTAYVWWTTARPSKGPTYVLVQVDDDASAAQVGRGITSTVMQKVTREVVAATRDVHGGVEGDAFDHARDLAAALPHPQPDRAGYIAKVKALHAELSRLGRPEILNDIQALVAETQDGRTITKNQLRSALYRRPR